MNIQKQGNFVRMFKPQFAPLVESGTKLQTVRPTPRRMPKAGDTISLRVWTEKPYRSKQRVLMESTISRVSKITITEVGYEHWEEEGWGVRMNPDSLHAFAQRDGFADWPALVDWFRQTHGLPFEGILVRWELPSTSASPEV